MLTPSTKLTALLPGLAVAAAPLAGAAQLWPFHVENVLGAPAHFMVLTASEAQAKAATRAALTEVSRLDAVFNHRREASELSRLNHIGQVIASPDLFEVVSQAEALRAASGGAFNPALGALTALWRQSTRNSPDPDRLQTGADAARPLLQLDPETRTIRLANGATLDLDGIAKGYIIDRALLVGLAASSGTAGLLVDIGGDMRCAGAGPDNGAWRIGVPDGSLPYANAPLMADLYLQDRAVAASGVGPRDQSIDGCRYSTTLDPWTGRAQSENLSATVVAKTAWEADGLATALLIMPPHKGLALAQSWPHAEARITSRSGAVLTTTGWTRLARERPPPLIRVANTKPAADSNKWLADWAVELDYKAPAKQENHDPDFRSPYMALWISDKAGKPVRTIMLVGPDPKYQKENFIWWELYRDQAPKLVGLRASATSLSGHYALYWPGYDDAWKMMPLGDYVLHVETSQEHGEHTYRSLPLTLGKQGFRAAMPPTKDGGGLDIVYGKRD